MGAADKFGSDFDRVHVEIEDVEEWRDDGVEQIIRMDFTDAPEASKKMSEKLVAALSAMLLTPNEEEEMKDTHAMPAEAPFKSSYEQGTSEYHATIFAPWGCKPPTEREIRGADSLTHAVNIACGWGRRILDVEKERLVAEPGAQIRVKLMGNPVGNVNGAIATVTLHKRLDADSIFEISNTVHALWDEMKRTPEKPFQKTVVAYSGQTMDDPEHGSCADVLLEANL